MENLPARSEEIEELVKALIKVQAQLKPAKKKSKNPFFKSTYADLVEVWDTCRKLLVDNGFAIIQSTRMSERGEIIVITTLAHISGQWWSGELGTMPVKIVKNKETGEEKEVTDPQILGSCVSYLRRYGLSSLVGVVSEGEDDDGEAGTKPHRKWDKDTYKEPFSNAPREGKKADEVASAMRSGQVYSEQTNNIIKAFDSIGVGIGGIEDILKHDLTNVSEEELTTLRKIYAEEIVKKGLILKERKTRSDKGQPRKERDAFPCENPPVMMHSSSPFTEAELDVDDYVQRLPVPIRDEMKRLWWGADKMRAWLKEQGVNDTADLMRNQETFESILKKLGKLQVDKK